MSIVSPGEKINHTWVIKNVGDTLWENRYYECNQSMMELDEKNRILRFRNLFTREIKCLQVYHFMHRTNRELMS